jgi:hypothetical protein
MSDYIRHNVTGVIYRRRPKVKGKAAVKAAKRRRQAPLKAKKRLARLLAERQRLEAFLTEA